MPWHLPWVILINAELHFKVSQLPGGLWPAGLSEEYQKRAHMHYNYQRGGAKGILDSQSATLLQTCLLLSRLKDQPVCLASPSRMCSYQQKLNISETALYISFPLHITLATSFFMTVEKTAHPACHSGP